jgi:hypothetical protein
MRGRHLESFGMKSKPTWDGLLFIGSKLLAAVLKLESQLVVLELISSGSGLKPLLRKVFVVAVEYYNHY